jgi:hypothetical protein
MSTVALHRWVLAAELRALEKRADRGGEPRATGARLVAVRR